MVPITTYDSVENRTAKTNLPQQHNEQYPYDPTYQFQSWRFSGDCGNTLPCAELPVWYKREGSAAG